MGTIQQGCSVATLYTPEEYAWLMQLPFGANAVEQLTWCELEPGHKGRWHYGMAQGVAEGSWWVRWGDDGGREFVLRQSCPVTDPAYPVPPAPGVELELEPCCLFEGHPGRHDYEFSISLGSAVSAKGALTAGALRRLLADVPDDTPLRIAGATGTVLTPGQEVVPLAAGPGRVAEPASTTMWIPQDAVVVIVGPAEQGR